jgi:hypothetical protein
MRRPARFATRMFVPLLAAAALPALAAERASVGDPPTRSEAGQSRDRPQDLSGDTARQGIGNTPVTCKDGTIARVGRGACEGHGGIARVESVQPEARPSNGAAATRSNDGPRRPSGPTTATPDSTIRSATGPTGASGAAGADRTGAASSSGGASAGTRDRTTTGDGMAGATGSDRASGAASTSRGDATSTSGVAPPSPSSQSPR